MITMKKSWFWIILIIVFSFALLIGAYSEPKETIKEVEKEVCYREDTWKKLKEVDDRGFILSSESMSLASDAFIAISRFDLDEIEAITKKIEDKNEEMSSLAVKRQQILRELGY